MTYNKSTFAKFPSNKKDGPKADQKKNIKNNNNKRVDAVNKFKPHPPANNGWWYYEMFSRDLFNNYTYKKGKNRR